jgi:hypothetical protein
MKQPQSRVPSALSKVWAIVGCLSLASASLGHAVEIGEVAVATGYRQDSSSFSICSGLASPDFFGFGKIRSRDVHIWEIGIGASASLTDHAYLRAALSYGVILGGKVQDSGVADINSNPLNSVFGEYYTACCAPCNCDDTPCGCDCEDRIFRKSVQTSAYLNGNVVDFNVALGYAFRPIEDFMIAPVVGWTYNSQRQRWAGAIYGPLQVEGAAEPCPAAILQPVIGGFDYNSWEDPAFAELNPNILVDYFQGCVAFGNCFDGTVYRARWNGPFIGVDLGYALSDVWNVVVGYAFSYNNFNGKFVTLGGCEGDACDCDLCPTFFNASNFQLGDDLPTGPFYAFQPSEMRFSSWGIGQEVSVATDYRCGNWTAGIGVGYSYKQANHCADSEPCEAFRSVVNPNQAETAGTKAYPIWSYASLQKARWSSFSVLLTLGYQF